MPVEILESAFQGVLDRIRSPSVKAERVAGIAESRMLGHVDAELAQLFNIRYSLPEGGAVYVKRGVRLSELSFVLDECRSGDAILSGFAYFFQTYTNILEFDDVVYEDPDGFFTVYRADIHQGGGGLLKTRMRRLLAFQGYYKGLPPRIDGGRVALTEDTSSPGKYQNLTIQTRYTSDKVGAATIQADQRGTVESVGSRLGVTMDLDTADPGLGRGTQLIINPATDAFTLDTLIGSPRVLPISNDLSLDSITALPMEFLAAR